MEKEEKNIFYIGISEGEAAGRKELLREGLPIRKLGRKLPYLYWEKRNVAACLQVYFALLPQKEKRLWRELEWKRETAERVLAKTEENAALRWGCREQALHPLIGRNGLELPLELMAVGLYQHKPFDKVCLSLPEDGGYFAEQALWLLRPYLPRIRRAFICGGESQSGEKVREELYEEFGLVAMEAQKPEPGVVWLDLREDGGLEDRGQETGPQGNGSLGGMGRKADFQVKCVNRLWAWKFLDTAVKNGYNTKVN